MAFMSAATCSLRGGEAILAQEPLHHPVARERIFNVQLIDPVDQPEAILAVHARLIVEVAPAGPERSRL